MARKLIGSTEPRLWTPPLRRLSRKTSKGYDAADWIENELGLKLMPWQRWLLIHALELRPNGGGYRFRTVVTLVSRQNGKTSLLGALVLWRLLEDDARLALGTSTNLIYAAEAWDRAIELADASDSVRDRFKWPERRANGQETFTTLDGARYKIAAANRRGGRSLSVDLGIADELREHRDTSAWAAISGTTTARPDPQLWGISNQGDDGSVVLNQLRASALSFIGTGEGDDSLGLFEWSADDDADMGDREGWRQANPALGYTITEETIASKLATLTPADFRTEHLCQRVAALDAAFDADAWNASKDVGNLDGYRDSLGACVDVAPDGGHVSLVVAADVGDGKVRVEPVAAWSSTDKARDELGRWLDKIKPRAVAWFPGGPAAVLGNELRGYATVEIKGTAVNEVVMSLGDLVKARRVLHSGDPLLDAHVGGAQKLRSGEGWRLVRHGAGHCDAAYAAAGAVHVARDLPEVEPPMPRPAVY